MFRFKLQPSTNIYSGRSSSSYSSSTSAPTTTTNYVYKSDKTKLSGGMISRISNAPGCSGCGGYK